LKQPIHVFIFYYILFLTGVLFLSYESLNENIKKFEDQQFYERYVSKI